MDGGQQLKIPFWIFSQWWITTLPTAFQKKNDTRRWTTTHQFLKNSVSIMTTTTATTSTVLPSFLLLQFKTLRFLWIKSLLTSASQLVTFKWRSWACQKMRFKPSSLHFMNKGCLVKCRIHIHLLLLVQVNMKFFEVRISDAFQVCFYLLRFFLCLLG